MEFLLSILLAIKFLLAKIETQIAALKIPLKFGAIQETCVYKPVQLVPQPGANKTGTVNSLKSDITLNATVDSIFNKIQIAEDSYFSVNKKYWQGLKTHDQPVTYLSNVAADNRSCLINDIKKDWESFTPNIDFLTLPFQIEIHEYMTSKNEQGYQVLFMVQKDGVVYSKSKSIGVQNIDRTFDWTAYEN